MDLIEEIHRRLPDTHLVMHGSSSVPPELVAQVNRYGGALKPAWGVPVKEIQLGIRHGVRKINVDTDSRLAVTGAIRKVFAESPEKFDPRDYLKPARAAMQELIAEPDARLRPGRPRRRLRAALARGDARGLRRGRRGGVELMAAEPETGACSGCSPTRPGSTARDLTLGGVRAAALAEEFGTPLVVYCEQTLRARARSLRAAVGGGHVAFGTKAFANVAVLRLLREEGIGADVASSGELAFARAAGFRGDGDRRPREQQGRGVPARGGRRGRDRRPRRARRGGRRGRCRRAARARARHARRRRRHPRGDPDRPPRLEVRPSSRAGARR